MSHENRVQQRRNSIGPTNISDFELFKLQQFLEKREQAKISESWTDKQEELIHIWAIKSAGYRWLHMRAHEYYTWVNNIFSYPIIVLSSMVGVGGFAMISPEKPTRFELTLQYLFSICNMMIAILSSLHKFNRCSENSEQHHNSAIQYAKFYREIKMELTLEKKDRCNSIEFCKNIKEKYDALLSNSLEIPRHIITEFNIIFTNVNHKPDVANGMFELERHDIENTNQIHTAEEEHLHSFDEFSSDSFKSQNDNELNQNIQLNL
jgi:hypothetical protein